MFYLIVLTNKPYINRVCVCIYIYVYMYICIYVYTQMGFSCGSAGKEWAWNVGVLGLIPGLGWSPGEGKGYHFSILAWRISWAVSSMGSQRVGHNWVNFISLHFNLIYLYCSTIVSLINSVREYVFISVLAIQIFTHLNCLVSFCM